MSNRLSDRYPGRGILHTPLARLSSTPTPFAGCLVGRMQYAPTFPEKDEASSGRYHLLSRTMLDKSVFHFSISNRLSDRYLCRGVLHTPHIDSTSTPSPLAGRLVGRMQYAPTLSEKEEVSLGRCYLLSWTMGDKSVFHFSISNRLSDKYPCRGVLHTLHIDSTSTLSPLAGRLVRHMQYAPTFPEKEEVSSGRYFLSSWTMRDQYVFYFSISNRLSDRYPGRGVLNTPLARLSSTPTPFAGRLVGRMQYVPTLSKKEEVSLGRYFPLSWTMADKYVFHFSMSNRLSDRYPGRGVLNTPLARLSSTLSPLAGRIGGVCNTPLPCRQKNRISRVGGGLCFEKKERNPHFFSPCLIGYQIDTRVGAY